MVNAAVIPVKEASAETSSRKRALFFLLGVLCLGAGCAQNTPKHVGFAHVVTMETRYYLSGPQQAWPSEGSFKSGTMIREIQSFGSYSLVESADGIRAYISAGSFERCLSRACESFAAAEE